MISKLTRCVLEYVRRTFSPWTFNKKWIWDEIR